jgi:hypothetical protein
VENRTRMKVWFTAVGAVNGLSWTVGNSMCEEVSFTVVGTVNGMNWTVGNST